MQKSAEQVQGQGIPETEVRRRDMCSWLHREKGTLHMMGSFDAGRWVRTAPLAQRSRTCAPHWAVSTQHMDTPHV